VAPSPSSASEEEFDEAYSAELDVGLADPWQRFNRRMFGLNQGIDRWLLNPIARGYGWITPDPLERAIRNAFDNLDEPAIALNDLFQREWRRAGRALGRFLLNSSAGLAGLADPARRVGLARQDADFGQTLGKAGVASGPYLFLPVLGPTYPRDLLGYAVDSALHAESWVLPLRGELPMQAIDVISLKERYREELAELERGSIDYYAALRAGYAAQRGALLRNASCPRPDASTAPAP
jgi:phospholipid-binding lipoprotein MlaA